MKNILIHGLGQNNQSWDNIVINLKKNKMNTICPNLFEINNNTLLNYKNLYDKFSDFCNNQEEKVNLCGLSLGGILALDFAKEYPEKVNSIILIGTPYKIPKELFKVQNLIFKIMPKQTFENMGCSKRGFITLVLSCVLPRNSLYETGSPLLSIKSPICTIGSFLFSLDTPFFLNPCSFIIGLSFLSNLIFPSSSVS